MTTASVMVRVGTETDLHEDAYVSASGEARAILYVGRGYQAMLYGSPAALRRLAVAAVSAAERGERQLRSTRAPLVAVREPAAA
jgi:hypothetical protein